MASLSINWFGNESAADKAEVLEPGFYRRDTVCVAQDLLGKILVVSSTSGSTVGRIVETEAYHGDDPASHSARGKTPRCEIMFGEPGIAYIYFIYGMYEMLNFVTERKGYPGAVLIRALEPLSGMDLMRKRRKENNSKLLTRGPGRLCQAMGIKMSHNYQSLQGPRLFVLDDGYVAQKIKASERIGISKAKEKLWRFYVSENAYVSDAR